MSLFSEKHRTQWTTEHSNNWVNRCVDLYMHIGHGRQQRAEDKVKENSKNNLCPFWKGHDITRKFLEVSLWKAEDIPWCLYFFSHLYLILVFWSSEVSLQPFLFPDSSSFTPNIFSLFSQKASGTTLDTRTLDTVTPRKFFTFLLKMPSTMRNDGQQPYNIISNNAYYIRVCENENTQECNKHFLIQLRKKPHKKQQKNKQAKTGKTLSYLSTGVTCWLSSFKKLRVGHCLGNKVYYKWWYFPYTTL